MAAGMILAVKVREHDFGSEQRGPLKDGGAVDIGAAKQFMLAIGWADQCGVAELAGNPAAAALWA